MVVVWGFMPCVGIFPFFRCGCILVLILYNSSILVVILMGTCGLHGGRFWLFLLIMVVYWFFNWCRYFGHSDVGLYCMVL